MDGCELLHHLDVETLQIMGIHGMFTTVSNGCLGSPLARQPGALRDHQLAAGDAKHADVPGADDILPMDPVV